MNKNINFLREKVAVFKQERTKQLIFKTGLYIIVVLYTLSIVGLFSYNMILKRKSSIIDNNIDDKKVDVKELLPIETKQVYLKNKLKQLGSILSEQRENQRIIEAFFNVLPTGININRFEITKEGGVKIEGDSLSIRPMIDFFTDLEASGKIGDLKLKGVSVENVNFSYETGYSFELSLIFEG